MTNYLIPVQPSTAQQFRTTLNGTKYLLKFKYIDAPQAGWILDISDDLGNPVVSGVPLVTGADLLAQYGYLNFGFQLIVVSSPDPSYAPQFADLGVTSQLIAVY